MATLTKKMSPQQIEELYTRLKPFAVRETKPDYTYWQLKTDEMTVSAYTSGKVVFQGKDLAWLEEESKPQEKALAQPSSQFPMAGSDEVGTGDYFGPITVAACLVDSEQTAKKLRDMHITDSKAMTDAAIRKIAPILRKMLPCAIEILPNTQYNQVYDAQNMNINRIKTLMHNRAWTDLAKQQELPKNRIVDQFCSPEGYYRHLAKAGKKDIVSNLHFETKAEGKYIAVAAASVLARAAFLDYMDEMDRKYDFHFEKGAGSKVDACGRKFVQTHPDIPLEDVAKVHFANTRRIQKQTSNS